MRVWNGAGEEDGRGDEADRRVGRRQRVHQAGKIAAGHQLDSQEWPAEIPDLFVPIQHYYTV